MTTLIRFGATIELGLMVAEATGWFQGILPLSGSHVSQTAIVLGVVALLQDVVELLRDAVQWLRTTSGRDPPP